MKQVRPKKNLGQHFLVDLSIARRIADTVDVPFSDIPVLEVGPGMGVMTQFLTRKERPLKVVEIDRESVDYLTANHIVDAQQIIAGDFLRMDLSEVFGGQTFVLTGNYPYDISSQIFFKMLDNKDLIPCCTGMNSYNAWLKLGYNWGNLATAVRWNYELSPRLFMNLSGSYTRYRNDLSLGTEDEMHYGYHMSQLQTSKIEMDYNSGIHDLTARADFDYTPAPEHSIHFGTWMTHHIFTPEVLGAKLAFSDTDTTVSQDTTFGQSRVRAQEMVLYAEDDWALTDALKINAGVALSGFAVQGVFYPSVQPRLSGRFMVTDDISVKAGYSYMTQYLHLLSSSNISLPTDLWVPVTARIAPMNSRQVALGVFYDWRSLVNFSIEGYYKNMDNLMEYKPGSSFFGTSSNWEDKVCLGRGWAYGVEFLAQKSVGNLTGWLGYTWSRTWRQFDELNDGAAFPAKYDRIHDLSLTLQYRPNDRFDCGLTWVYSTGNTATLAYHRFETEAPEDVYYYPSSAYFVEQRNNYRLPAYHRMDLSFNFHRKFTRGSRTINVSVYNAYNRQNPFIIYPSTKYYSSDGSEYKTVLMQRSLFPILPSVSYTYKF